MNQNDSKTQSICLVQKTFSLKEEQITSQSILDREYLLAESTDSFYFFFFFKLRKQISKCLLQEIREQIQIDREYLLSMLDLRKQIPSKDKMAQWRRLTITQRVPRFHPGICMRMLLEIGTKEAFISLTATVTFSKIMAVLLKKG